MNRSGTSLCEESLALLTMRTEIEEGVDVYRSKYRRGLSKFTAPFNGNTGSGSGRGAGMTNGATVGGGHLGAAGGGANGASSISRRQSSLFAASTVVGAHRSGYSRGVCRVVAWRGVAWRVVQGCFKFVSS